MSGSTDESTQSRTATVGLTWRHAFQRYIHQMTNAQALATRFGLDKGCAYDDAGRLATAQMTYGADTGTPRLDRRTRPPGGRIR